MITWKGLVYSSSKVWAGEHRALGGRQVGTHVALLPQEPPGGQPEPGAPVEEVQAVSSGRGRCSWIGVALAVRLGEVVVFFLCSPSPPSASGLRIGFEKSDQ